MAYRVEIAPSALRNIEHYYQYIASRSKAAADVWFKDTVTAIESLEHLPKRYVLAPESKVLQVDIYHYIYKKYYRILYTVKDKVVKIHHVRHTYMKWMTDEDFEP